MVSLEDAEGRRQLPRAIHAALTADENLAARLAHALVDAHFPASLHAEILASAGIARPYVAKRTMPGDPHFSDQVLEAYGRRRAVCGSAAP